METKENYATALMELRWGGKTRKILKTRKNYTKNQRMPKSDRAAVPTVMTQFFLVFKIFLVFLPPA